MEFINNFNILKNSKLSYSDRIRIMRLICQGFIEYSKESMNYHLLILEDLTNKNSYKIAMNFNKNIINNLNEESKLYIPFLQLDSYVLFNYLINVNSYTFSLVPLILTKKHLLSNYDDFIFTIKRKEKFENFKLACQNRINNVTAINDYCLFPLFDHCDSRKLLGNDFAVHISIELLLKNNDYSKKKKSGNSPLYFYTRKSLKKFEEVYKKINRKDEDEACLLVEYFIKYKKDNIVQYLKNKYYFGNIIQDYKLFTLKNFKNLNEEKNKISINKNQNKNNEFQNLENTDKFLKNDKKEKKINLVENEASKNSLSYYENKYLFNGYFVYPDSLPVNYVTVIGRKKNNEKEMPQGLIEYIEKYKKAIIEGRKSHYGKDN